MDSSNHPDNGTTMTNTAASFDTAKAIALIGSTPYWLAGGQNADPDQIESLKNPKHDARIAWAKQLEENLGKLPKDTPVVIALESGTSLDAAEVVIKLGLPLVIVKENNLHYWGRTSREEEAQAIELEKKAAQVVTLGQAPFEKASRQEWAIYNKEKRPAEVTARRQWLAANTTKAITASHTLGSDEKAFIENKKAVDQVRFPLNPAKSGVVTFWHPALPSLGAAKNTTLLFPSGENDLLSWNSEKNTSEIQRNTLVAIQDIGTHNLPDNIKPPMYMGHPHRLGQYQVGKVEHGTVDQLFQELLENPTAYNFPPELTLALQTDGKWDIKKLTKYCAALLPDSSVRGQTQTMVNEIIEARTYPERHRDIMEKAAAQAATMLEHWKAIADNGSNAEDIEKSFGDKSIHSICENNQLSTSQKTEQIIAHLVGPRRARIQELLHNEGITNLLSQKKADSVVASELFDLLLDPTKVQVALAPLTRKGEPIEIKLSEQLTARTGLSQDQLYAGEINAWVENTLKGGRIAGTSFNAEVNVTHQPALDQETHPDTYHAELPEIVATNIVVPNIPGYLLPAYRTEAVDPTIADFLFLPNTVRWLANEKDATLTGKEFKAKRFTVGNDDTIVPYNATVQAHLKNELSDSCAGLLRLTIEDIDQVKAKGIWAEQIATGQTLAGTDGRHHSRPIAEAGWNKADAGVEHSNGGAIDRTDRRNRGQITARGQDGLTETRSFDMNRVEENPRLQLTKKAVATLAKAITPEGDRIEDSYKAIRAAEGIFEGRTPDILKEQNGKKNNGVAVDPLIQRFRKAVERYEYLFTQANTTNDFGEKSPMPLPQAQELEKLTKVKVLMEAAIVEAAKDIRVTKDTRDYVKNPLLPLWDRALIACGLKGVSLEPDREQHAVKVIAALLDDDIQDRENILAAQTSANAAPKLLEITTKAIDKLKAEKTKLQDIVTAKRLAEDAEKAAILVPLEAAPTAATKAKALQEVMACTDAALLEAALSNFYASEKVIPTDLTRCGKLTADVLAQATNRACTLEETQFALRAALLLVQKDPQGPVTNALEAIVAVTKDDLELKVPLKEVKVGDDKKLINRLGQIVTTGVVSITQGNEIAQRIFIGLESGHVINAQRIDQRVRRRAALLYSKATAPKVMTEGPVHEERITESRERLKANQTWIEDRPTCHPASALENEQYRVEHREKFTGKIQKVEPHEGLVTITLEDGRTVEALPDDPATKAKLGEAVALTLYPYGRDRKRYTTSPEASFSISRQVAHLPYAAARLYNRPTEAKKKDQGRSR